MPNWFFFGERYDGRVQFLKPGALLKFLYYDNLLLFVSYGKEMNKAIFWFIQANDQQYERTER